jgi:hypothetical protein
LFALPVLATVGCVLLTLKGWQAKEQAEVLEWVEDGGGVVEYDESTRRPKWLHKALGVYYPASVIRVVVVDCPANDAARLSSLNNVERLFLMHPKITDVSPLGRLTELKYVGLFNAPFVSDISPLANCTELEHLLLVDTGVTDLSPLKDLSKLKCINVGGTIVSDEEVSELKEALPSCEISFDAMDFLSEALLPVQPFTDNR